jgi:hypothetical protein
MDGTVNGDLMAAGESVIINGVVTGDLFVAGSRVTINGSVGDDLFAAGAAVTLGPDATIADDVFSAGASVEAQAGSEVGGTFQLAAAQGLLSGGILENLYSASSSLRLEGTIAGNADVAVDGDQGGFAPGFTIGPNNIRVPAIPSGLSFGDEANIAGSLEFTSPKSFNVPASVTEDVTHSLPTYDAELAREIRRDAVISSPILNAIRRLVSLLLVGALIGWALPGWLRRLSGTIQNRPLPSIGFGLLNFVAAPLILVTMLGVIILVGFVIGALSLGNLAAPIIIIALLLTGLAVMAYIVVIAYLCQAAIAYLTGRWILSKVRPEWNGHLLWPLLLGLLLTGLIFTIPVAGSLLQLMVIFAGLGAILISMWESRKVAPVTAEMTVVEA